MKNNVIHKHIRKISLKRMLYPFLLIVFTIYIFQQIPFINTLKPAKMEHISQLESAFQKDDYFVDISLKELFYSGYDYVENGKISASYYYIIEDGICYYFLISKDSFDIHNEILKDIRIRGKIEVGGKNLNSLISNMAKDLSWTSSELRKVSSPLLIKEAKYLQSKTIWLLGINSLMFLGSCFLFLHALSFTLVPLLHPSCIYLRRYGSVRQQIKEIESELAEEMRLKCKNLIVTTNYLIEISNNHLKILPLSQVLWAYKHSNFHQFRLFSNKLTYTLRVIGKKSGKLVSTLQPKSDVDMVLKYLEENFPEVLVGYSKENEKTAKKMNWI